MLFIVCGKMTWPWCVADYSETVSSGSLRPPKTGHSLLSWPKLSVRVAAAGRVPGGGAFRTLMAARRMAMAMSSQLTVSSYDLYPAPLLALRKLLHCSSGFNLGQWSGYTVSGLSALIWQRRCGQSLGVGSVNYNRSPRRPHRAQRWPALWSARWPAGWPAT
jgi:hypothetical protein